MKLVMDRYQLANHLRTAAEKYKECASTTPDTHPHIRANFNRSHEWCLAQAEELEGSTILGDVILLEG